MCMKTTCQICKKPTWAGCGRHVEMALAGVPVADRCRCREEKDERQKKVVKISSDTYAGPQLEQEDIPLLLALGIKTVVNLRDPSEDGYRDLAEKLQSVKIVHHSAPWTLGQLTTAAKDVSGAEANEGYGKAADLERATDHLLATMDTVERPAIIVCRTAKRASVVATAHAHSRGAKESEQALDKVHQLGVPEDEVAALAEYTRRKAVRQAQRMGTMKCSNDLFISAQPTEEDLKKAAEKLHVKTVINLRNPLVELGSLGLGVLAREPELVQSLGMEYVNYRTEMGAEPTKEELNDIVRLVEESAKPVLIHCRLGKRSKNVAEHLGCTGASPV